MDEEFETKFQRKSCSDQNWTEKIEERLDYGEVHQLHLAMPMLLTSFADLVKLRCGWEAVNVVEQDR